VAMIHETTRRSDARLVAYAVMPNHLHVVLIQGDRPLSAYMQPLLCRIALLVQRRHRREGHVFERRYRESACTDAEYFRNAVAYVHLNPVRARLCNDPSSYDWTSHRAFCGRTAVSARFEMNIAAALRAFEVAECASARDRRAAYFNFLGWRVRMDAFLAAGGQPADPAAPARPWCRAGDAHWAREVGVADRGAPEPVQPRPRADLRQIARQIIAEDAPGMNLDWVRSGERTRTLVVVRRRVIARALDAGHTRSQIARYLQVSLTTVSDTAIALRRPVPA
jgi:REP element-mobilizing transposase RayT